MEKGLNDDFLAVKGGGRNSGIRTGLTNKNSFLDSGLETGIEPGSKSFLPDKARRTGSKIEFLRVNQNARLSKMRKKIQSKVVQVRDST